jgi:radical SAM-linked protein
MPSEKFRFRFSKSGSLRLLSHLDLTRCVERMLRRAALPFKSTGGFHPTPRMIFALSLPLGVAGQNEVLELELTAPHAAEDVSQRLNRQAPQGLNFHTVSEVSMKASAVPRRIVYSLSLPPERIPDIRQVAETLLNRDKVWVERLKPRPRRLNIRPYLRSLSIDATGTLNMDLWVTSTGTARADELAILLGVSDCLDTGAVLVRSELELRDEVAPDLPDQPPDGPPETAPWEPPIHAGADAPNDEMTSATWGLSPHGPIVE